MQNLLSLSRLIDTISTWIGKLTMWLILATTLISAGNAIVRKAFDTSSNGLLEIQWYLFAAVFMLGAGYGFLRNSHVRIDFISSRLSDRMRNWIDLLGIVFVLFPFCILMVTLSWPFFMGAYSNGEMSQNAGGLIRWPVYLLVPVGFTILAIQGISELIKRIAFLRGVIEDPIGGESAKSDEQKHIEELERIAAARLAGEK
ncbi:TRAP transporter small permease subunit [Polaromonas sp. YR568]|uniref:TRAP transporter small permease subunit n=1 Tax=Polaromonas sp. YR568 TaxID=1855301 RepID=UPI0031383714